MSEEAPHQLPAWVTSTLCLVLSVGLLWMFHFAFDTRIALDVDVVNVALGIDRFDVQAHQPHPPGYLGYVLLLRVVHGLVGLDVVATAKLVALLMASATAVLVFLSARELCKEHPAAARWSVALCASNPLLIYYAIDGQTHAAEAAAAAALLFALARQHRHPSHGALRPLVIGLLLAVGGAFRPSFAVIAVVPVVYCYWRHWRALLYIGVAAVAGTLLWLVPTVQLAGGWHAYRDASDALLGMFARKSSVLSSESDGRMVLDNLRGVGTWALLALGTALFGLRWRRGNANARWAYAMVAMMAGPALVFYALVYVAEAGYLLGLVPAATLATGIALGVGGQGRHHALAATAVIAQLLFFFAAPSPGSAGSPWLPTASEIFYRQLIAESAVDELSANLVEADRVLAISDVGPAYLLRQLPRLRAHTDVLVVFSEHLSMYETTTLGLATATGWRAAPGPALLVPGAPSLLTTTATYDDISLGPYFSESLRQELQAQTPCPVELSRNTSAVIRLPAARCFPDHQVTLGPHLFRWAATGNSVTPRPGPP